MINNQSENIMKFLGTNTCLKRWATIVTEKTGKKCSSIDTSGISAEFTVDLTDSERETLMAVWYVIDEEKSNAFQMPWNYRITFSFFAAELNAI